MKKLLLIPLLLLGCKKKDTPPAEPCVCPVTVCSTGPIKFTGKWKSYTTPYDTIEFIFKHNNCPKENSNTYVVGNFAEAMNPTLNIVLSPNVEFEIISDEVYWTADTKDKAYHFSMRHDGILQVNGKNLKYGTVNFESIK